MIESVVTGILANYFYGIASNNLPESILKYLPAFLNANPSYLNEAEKLVLEVIDEARTEYKDYRTVLIFLQKDHIISEGVFHPIFEYIFHGGKHPEKYVTQSILSCRVGNEFTGGRLKGQLSAGAIARGLIKSVEQKFRASERLVGFLTHTCLENITRKVDALYDCIKRTSTNVDFNGSPNNSEEEIFLSDYSNYLKRQVKNIRIHGIEKITSEGSLRQNLRSSYIDVELSSINPKNTSLKQIVKDVNRRHNVYDAINIVDYLIIKGGAGTGKTTLFHNYINNFNLETAQGNKERFPIYLPLRKIEKSYISDWGFDNIFFETLADNVLQKSYPSKLSRYIKHNSARFIFFLDGLDEISEGNRNKFWDIVEDIDQKFPLSKIVIATRNLSNVHYSDGTLRDSLFKDRSTYTRVKNQWRPSEKFFELNICELSNTQISEFIDKWFDGINTDFHAVTLEDNNINVLAAKLKGLLFASKEAESLNLARTPLLCSLICLVYFLRDGTLPSSRRQLYETATKLLIEVRDAERNVRVPDQFTKFNISHRERLFQCIALEMQEGDSSRNSQNIEVARETVEIIVEQWLVNNAISGVDAKLLLDFLIERCSILREPSHGVIDFVHRSFMEFLAAQEIVLRRGPHSIRTRIENEQWLSTLKFCMDTPTGGVYFGGMLVKELVRFVNEKYSKRKFDEHRRALGYRIASLLDSDSEYPQEVNDELVTLCELVLPPQTLSEAEDCYGIPFNYFRNKLSFGTVSGTGNENTVKYTAILLSQHKDNSCSDLLNTGFQKCADKDVIEAVNLSGRVRISDHFALRARIENGSYRGKVFLTANDIQVLENRKLIGKSVGIRFPFRGNEFVGWRQLRNCREIALLHPVRSDWDQLLSRNSKSAFNSCGIVEIRGGADFNMTELATLFPSMKYLIIEDCRHFSVSDIEKLHKLEEISFHRVSYPLKIDVAKLPNKLSGIDFLSCSEVGISGDKPNLKINHGTI